MKLIPLILVGCAASTFCPMLSPVARAADPHSNPYADRTQWVPSDVEIATITRTDRMMLEAAVQQYAAGFHKAGTDAVTFDDVKVYLRSDSRLYRSHGRDILGNAYRFSAIAAGVAISPDTLEELASVSREFWAEP